MSTQEQNEVVERTIVPEGNVIDLEALTRGPVLPDLVNPLVLVMTPAAIEKLGYVEGVNTNDEQSAFKLQDVLDHDVSLVPLPLARNGEFYQVCSYEIVVKQEGDVLKALAFIHKKETGDSLNIGLLGSVSLNTLATFQNSTICFNDTVRNTIMAGRQTAFYADPEKSTDSVNGDFFISEHIPGQVLVVTNETPEIKDRKIAYVNILIASPGMALDYTELLTGQPEITTLGFAPVEELKAMVDAQDETSRLVLEVIENNAEKITAAATALATRLAEVQAEQEKLKAEAGNDATGGTLPWEEAPAASNVVSITDGQPVEAAEVAEEAAHDERFALAAGDQSDSPNE